MKISHVRIVLPLLVILALTPGAPSAQATFQVLHQFNGGPGDGAAAYGSLVEATDGNLYGTTQRGGAFDLGTVYRISPGGVFTLLYSFTGGADGALPTAGLIQGANGSLYGTAIRGGSGSGTVFRITLSGAFGVLHTFPIGGGDTPYAPLTLGGDGNFYGVTFGGPSAIGNVYRLTPSGGYTSLHAFTGAGESSPFAGLVEGLDGNFYGTTRFGLIYRVSPAGAFAAIRFLDVNTEGTTIDAALALGVDGNLYGAARNGGPNGRGTIFRITPAGAFTLLHAFTGGSDGEGAEAGLIRGPDGNFYGVTAGNPPSTAGRRVFRITPSGVFTVLHTFVPSDSSPYAPLVIGGGTDLYGTTNGGGGRSIVFRLPGVFLLAGPPFGSLDTPLQGTVVAGEVPVTGWALDDTDVSAVNVYRSPLAGEPTQPNGLVFLGSAAFVDGARPDVAALYPTYPNNARAGWGYMLLSNMLPNGGNGTFTLSAVAVDQSGNSTSLGQRSIVAANSGDQRPFGTIDTPAPGAMVSGVVNNFGWALTPNPSTIPFDGSTITVYVDSIPVGHPTYNLFRSDIAALFPGYANSNGAVGYFSLDTRTLTNGVHVLSWVVIDNNGNTRGLGSRYITVNNP